MENASLHDDIRFIYHRSEVILIWHWTLIMEGYDIDLEQTGRSWRFRSEILKKKQFQTYICNNMYVFFVGECHD